MADDEWGVLTSVSLQESKNMLQVSGREDTHLAGIQLLDRTRALCVHLILSSFSFISSLCSPHILPLLVVHTYCGGFQSGFQHY